jgi:hypothetical protein
MNIWPAKVITPTTTYEKCVLKTEIDGTLTVQHSRGMDLAHLAVADREDLNPDTRHYRYLGVNGEQWEVIATPGCGCGGTVEYPTVATSQPA